MPSYTLIALLLSIFGAIMSLISALRSHHGDYMKIVKGEHQRLCDSLMQKHEKGGRTFQDVEKAGRKITNWLWFWERAMVAPIWIFSFVVSMVSIVALQVDWPGPNSTAGIPAVDTFIVLHSTGCKFVVGGLLLSSIVCYLLAWFGQKMVRSTFEEMQRLDYSVRERLLGGITAANPQA